MGDDEGAANYMLSYGEGPGSELRFRLGELLKPGEKVLDVGCGPGWNFDHFLEHGPSVIYRGIDYSERFVRVANKRTGTKVFEVGDVRDISEPDESFDVVILQDVLEHTNGYEKPLKEALRVARRVVIITFWHLTENDDHININKEENDLDGWGAWYSQGKWEAFLSKCGYPWTHEKMPRKGAFHDIYIVNKDEHGNLPPTRDGRTAYNKISGRTKG
jgi:ubiquinone/menaquinone biosynthesis C-methylase UbiE